MTNIKSITKNFLKPIAFHDIVVLIAIGSILLFQLEDIAKDPGLGWHLKTGERVFETKNFIYQDFLLATDSKRAWIANQWLSDVFLYIFYKYFSWFGLYVFTILSFSYVYLGVLYKKLQILKLNPIISSVVLLLVFKVSQIHLIIRPVTFSFILLSFLTYFLVKNYNKKFSIKFYTIISIIFVLWANMHPTFFVGFLAIGIFGIVELLHKNYKRFIDYLLLGLLALVATFINPYFINLHKSIFWLQSSFATYFYDEWQPININQNAMDFYLILVGLSIISIFTKRNKLLLSFQILSLIFSIWAFNVVRMLPYFAIFISVPATKGLLILIRPLFKLKYFSLVKFASKSLSERELSLIPGKRAFLITSLVILIGYPKILLNSFPLGMPEYFYPKKALNFLKKNSETNVDYILFHDFDWGGYISLYGEGKILATVDDRSKLLGEKFVFDYLDILKNDKDYKPLFKKLKITHVLIRKDTDFSKELKKRVLNFKLLFEDKLAVLYKVV